MQAAVESDRAPGGVLRAAKDAGACADLVEKSGRMASMMGSICAGWMLHMRRKPNSSRARRASARTAAMSRKLGADVVRRHDAVAEGGRGNLGLGARDQRMDELAG